MPYIKQEERQIYESTINSIVEQLLVVAETDENNIYGQFNYIISSIIKRYIGKKGKRYFRLQHFVGTLDCVKEEFRRRAINNYEDEMIELHGDI